MVRRSRRTLSRAEQLIAEGEEIQYPKPPRRRSSSDSKENADRIRRAIAKYSEAIKLDPLLAEAYIRRAGARRRSGDRRGARADARMAYGLRPSDPMDYLLISFPFPWNEQRRILRAGIARARRGSTDHLFLGTHSAHTYWYEGRFDLQLRATLRLIRHFEAIGKSRSLAGLHYQAGIALIAMARYTDAERHLRAAFRNRSTTGMLARTSAIECRIYRDDLRGALEILEQVAPQLDQSLVTLTRAYIHALGPAAIKVPKVQRDRLLAPDRASRHDYMGAVVLLRLGLANVAAPRLRRFIKHCEGNPREWGVTMRWEIAKAKELLAGHESG